MKNNSDFETIFSLIKSEMKNYKHPVVSNPDWQGIKNTPFTTLVSCILSLRTKDEVTEKASQRLLIKYSTPEKILSTSEEEIQTLIYPVGFYKNKSKTLKEISKTILEKYNGEVPEDLNELLTLKGVGRKTANIVMVYGFKHKDFLPIDTHCHRIPNRLGWIQTKTPDESEIALKKILPKEYWFDFNHLFVQFGQTVCVPISPFCSICPIEKYCKKNNVIRQR